MKHDGNTKTKCTCHTNENVLGSLNRGLTGVWKCQNEKVNKRGETKKGWTELHFALFNYTAQPFRMKRCTNCEAVAMRNCYDHFLFQYKMRL